MRLDRPLVNPNGKPRVALARGLVLGAALIAACSRPITLVGTVLDARPAPEFTLTDALSSQALTLSSLRGNVVALPFLYTHCPDTCPLTAEHFREAQTALGPDAARVHFVAMSVDPVNDTPESVRAFTADHRLTTNWHCLIGDRSRLEIVWALYGVGAFTFCTPHARARYLSATEDGRHSEA